MNMDRVVRLTLISFQKTTYNFQLVLIITYMLLTYPQVNLHVNGLFHTFFQKSKDPGWNYVALKTPYLHGNHSKCGAKERQYYSSRDSYI